MTEQNEISDYDLKRRREEGLELLLDYGKGGGLIPVVVQDYQTKEVLMLGYINRDAFETTLQTTTLQTTTLQTTTLQTYRAAFWSRSRGKSWIKGEEESGNFLNVVEIKVDCDQDAIVYLVEKEKGGACHTKDNGDYRNSCFYRKLNPETGNLEFV